MNVATFFVAVGSLVVALVAAFYARRSAKAAERSAADGERSANAGERSAAAAERSANEAKRATDQSKRSADAAEEQVALARTAQQEAGRAQLEIERWEGSVRVTTGQGIVVHNVGKAPASSVQGHRIGGHGYDHTADSQTVGADERIAVGGTWTVADGLPVDVPAAPKTGYLLRVTWKNFDGTPGDSGWKSFLSS